MKIQLHDKTFELYIPSIKIQARIQELAIALTQQYADKCPIILAIFNGSFMFAADIMKHLKFDCEISFVKITSYQGTTSSGTIKTLIGLEVDLTNRPVIILEEKIVND